LVDAGVKLNRGGDARGPLRVLAIFGTRPEAIKMAPVVRALQARPDKFAVRTCATAQHREMLDQVLALFDLAPDIDLDLMQPGQTLSGLAARVLTHLDPVLVAERPDWILVQGDTTTVMMAALAAQHRQIRVGHVEAGLRTRDRRNPFPEEMNRVVADHVSDLCFAPTEMARDNLLAEGIPASTIRVTGNTVIDALLQVAGRDWQPDPDSSLARLPADREWLLVTAHRRENFGEPLQGICQALRTLADQRGDSVHVIYPVHRNPQVWGPVHEALGDHPGITLLPPVDYREMVYLMKRCRLILTDSGGLQEEAPSLHKPVLVLRETTERPEALAAGATRLAGTDPRRIVREAHRLLDDPEAYAAMASAGNPYGDGHAAERIAAELGLKVGGWRLEVVETQHATSLRPVWRGLGVQGARSRAGGRSLPAARATLICWSATLIWRSWGVRAARRRMRARDSQAARKRCWALVTRASQNLMRTGSPSAAALMCQTSKMRRRTQQTEICSARTDSRGDAPTPASSARSSSAPRRRERRTEGDGLIWSIMRLIPRTARSATPRQMPGLAIRRSSSLSRSIGSGRS